MIRYVRLGSKIYGGQYRRIAVFVLRSLIHNSKMKGLIDFFRADPLRNDICTAVPEVFEQATRPIFYRDATFDEKAALIMGHYSFIESNLTEQALRQIYLGPGIRLWSACYEGKIISLFLLFQWYHKKDGLMALELRLDNERVYQTAFWVAPDEKAETALWIGSIQGARGGLNINRGLTRHFFGYRPKSFIVHALRVIARRLAIKQLYAVSNYGFHASFRRSGHRLLKTSLDEFWQETGGELCADRRFFRLPVFEPRKGLAEIASHKRNLYRKRFAVLEAVEADIARTLAMCLKNGGKEAALADSRRL